MRRRGRRRREGRRGRFPKPVNLGAMPSINAMIPNPDTGLNPIPLNTAELEALRLVDLEGLTQKEAGERMGVSRGTVWRLLQTARKKTAQALTEGRTIHIISRTR